MVDITVQEKAGTFPTDAKLLHRARVQLSKKHGLKLRQADTRVGTLRGTVGDGRSKPRTKLTRRAECPVAISP